MPYYHDIRVPVIKHINARETFFALHTLAYVPLPKLNDIMQQLKHDLNIIDDYSIAFDDNYNFLIRVKYKK